MNEITKDILRRIAVFKEKYMSSAYSIREDGDCVGRQANENVTIENTEGKPGIVVHVKAGSKGETVYIPTCVTKSMDDLVYNDFYIGEGAECTIVAGCGVHTDSHEAVRHNGVHRFFLGKDSKVKYLEKHVGTGEGEGIRSIDPVTEVYIGEGAFLEMDTSQIGGVDRADRKTTGTIEARGKLLVRERLLTEGEQTADTYFDVELKGEDSSADIISRSVARGKSRQTYTSTITGSARCSGHSECDSIIDGEAIVDAAPRLNAHHSDAALIHEAAIGKIAGEQILKLRSLGLTEQEAENMIIEGFLS